jgi:hypothetical protein
MALDKFGRTITAICKVYSLRRGQEDPQGPLTSYDISWHLSEDTLDGSPNDGTRDGAFTFEDTLLPTDSEISAMIREQTVTKLNEFYAPSVFDVIDMRGSAL